MTRPTYSPTALYAGGSEDFRARNPGLLEKPAPSVEPREEKPTMNKWEKRYAEHLETLRVAGQVLWWGFEKVRLKLADGAWFTPDFLVVNRDGHGVFRVEFHEVKGFWREAAKVRLKVAREHFPIPIRVVRWEGGTWVEEKE